MKKHLFILSLLANNVFLFAQTYSADLNEAFLHGKEIKAKTRIDSIFSTGTDWELVSNSIDASVKRKSEKKLRKFLGGNQMQVNENIDLGNVTRKSKNVIEVAYGDTLYESIRTMAYKSDTVVVEIKIFTKESKSGWFNMNKQYREIYRRVK